MGNAEPAIDMLSTAHSELILIDIRSEGISPKAKMPKPCDANTCISPKSTNIHGLPRWGKCKW